METEIIFRNLPTAKGAERFKLGLPEVVIHSSLILHRAYTGSP